MIGGAGGAAQQEFEVPSAIGTVSKILNFYLRVAIRASHIFGRILSDPGSEVLYLEGGGPLICFCPPVNLARLIGATDNRLDVLR